MELPRHSPPQEKAGRDLNTTSREAAAVGGILLFVLCVPVTLVFGQQDLHGI